MKLNWFSNIFHSLDSLTLGERAEGWEAQAHPGVKGPVEEREREVWLHGEGWRQAREADHGDLQKVLICLGFNYVAWLGVV